MKKFIFLGFFLGSLISCKKQEMGPSYANLIINFSNTINGNPIQLNSQNYVNSEGEEFNIKTLNYFISNIQLIHADGTILTVKDGYFLIKESDPNSKNIILDSIPAGNYSEIRFILGVDSLKSCSPVDERKGALDIASYGDDNMYWSWNSGYIFFKFEGTSPQASSTPAGNIFQFHIGGFGGLSAPTTNNIRQISLPLTKEISAQNNSPAYIHLEADIFKVFTGINRIKLSETSIIMNPLKGKAIADNYQNMFSVKSIE